MKLAVCLCVLALCSAACDERHLIGRACDGGRCEPAHVSRGPVWPDLPAPGGCGVQLALEASAEGDDVDRCEVFSLKGFGMPNGAAYLSGLELVMTPLSHLEARLAAELPYADGPLPCEALWSQPVAWTPLITALGESDRWDYRAAPYALRASDRVLVQYHFINLDQASGLRVGAKLNLECPRAAPAVITQAFALEPARAGSLEVRPGARLTVAAECKFDEDVVVSRLHRPVRGIARYRVKQSDAGTWLWETDETRGDWTFSLRRSLVLPGGAALRWECDYENDDVLPLIVGSAAADACTLFGSYYLPAGGGESAVQHCRSLAPE